MTRVEERSANFMDLGAAAFHFDADAYAAHATSSVMTDDETLADLLDGYAIVAARTDKLLGDLDLDTEHPLPTTPWWPEGMRWSIRRVAFHVAAETAQHGRSRRHHP